MVLICHRPRPLSQGELRLCHRGSWLPWGSSDRGRFLWHTPCQTFEEENRNLCRVFIFVSDLCNKWLNPGPIKWEKTLLNLSLAYSNNCKINLLRILHYIFSFPKTAQQVKMSVGLLWSFTVHRNHSFVRPMVSKNRISLKKHLCQWSEYQKPFNGDGFLKNH